MHTTIPDTTAESSAPTSRQNVVLAICCLSLLVVSMDATIVNVALPDIRRDLGASITGLQWVIDAYTIVIASLLMLGGSTADRFGRRRVPGGDGPVHTGISFVQPRGRHRVIGNRAGDPGAGRLHDESRRHVDHRAYVRRAEGAGTRHRHLGGRGGPGYGAGSTGRRSIDAN